jgi:hypothetical protein
MNLQAVSLKAVAGALGDGARTLALEPGAQLVARVVDVPGAGGRGTISLAGALLRARLPAGVERGQTLSLTVVRLDQAQLLVRIRRAGSGDSASVAAMTQAAGRLAVSGDGELLRAALAIAGSDPLWLPDGGAAAVKVEPDSATDGTQRASAGEASFVLHSPDHGPIEVRLRLAPGAIRAEVVTNPGAVAETAESALSDLIERLADVTGRPAAATVGERPAGRRPPPPPVGRVDVQA